MPDPALTQDRFSKAFLIALVVGISVLFFMLIRDFILTVLIAAILTGMLYPMYSRIYTLVRERKKLAAALTVLIVLAIIVVPASGGVGIVVTQAVDVSESAIPWVSRQIEQPDALDSLIQRLPFSDRLEPYREDISRKVAELAGMVGNFAVDSLGAITRGTVTFFLHLFVMLYAMFFFFIGGREILNKILYYMPLGPEQENRMVDRFVSVAKATLKGTIVIGLVQGTLGGLAFFVAGINGYAFWGTVMVVLSVIPGLGTALVWVPAVIYLLATGEVGWAIGLSIWFAVLVGSMDNVLRPWLVGKDTKMSDLMILLSTLGGLLLFGAVGFIVGPIVAALFVTVWEIYGTAFKDLLPDVE